MQVFETVNFGASKTGLSTVGYTIINTDGSTYQARSTTGVFETVAGSGIYGFFITVPDTFQGVIVWDTGDSPIRYASTEFDYRLYIASSGGSTTISGGGGTVVVPSENTWSEKEKNDVIKNINLILKLIKATDTNKDREAVLESLSGIAKRQEFLMKKMETDVKLSESNLKVESIKNLEALNALAEAVTILLDHKMLEDSIQEATGNVN